MDIHSYEGGRSVVGHPDHTGRRGRQPLPRLAVRLGLPRRAGWSASVLDRSAARSARGRDRPAEDIERATWSMHVNVADADKTAETVIAAGGHVLTPPYDLGAAGRAALFADHSGTAFAVWQAGGRPGAGAVDEPGTFHQGELITDDVEASAAFYHSVFGWTLGSPEGPCPAAHGSSTDAPSPNCCPGPRPCPPRSLRTGTSISPSATPRPPWTGSRPSAEPVLMGATPLAHGTIAVFADPPARSSPSTRPPRRTN
ncbi:hypothetical protein ACRAWF_05245 [Streptomyces sp. L7]